MEKKRARLMILPTAAAAFATLFLCYIALTFPAREPRYKGKPLSRWLPRLHNAALSSKEQNEARAALEHIGTNNLALLLAWFREKQPPYEEPSYKKALNKLLAKQRLIRFTFRERYQMSRPSMAYWVFIEVPAVTKTAFPQFIKMLIDKDDEVKGKACMVLGKSGKDAISFLVPELSSTNSIASALAAWALGEIGPVAKTLIPTLEAMLSDGALSVRLNAAEALGKMGGEPRIFAPILVQCLQNGDQDSREYAANALSALRERGCPAVPGLLNLLVTCTTQNDRSLYFSALAGIDPGAAEQVGSLIDDR